LTLVDNSVDNNSITLTNVIAAYTHSNTTHDYAYITGNDGATDITATELEELTDGSATTLHSHAAVSAHTHDGDTLQLDGINSDGGAFAFTTSGNITFAENLIITDGKSVGQTAGPALTFDDTNNYLEIVRANVGINITTPSAKLHVSDDSNAVAASLLSNDCVLISKEDGACGQTIVIASDASDSHRGVFKGVRARGDLDAPSAANDNDYVLSFLGAIFDGTDTEATASIDFYVDGAVSSNVAPQRITFSTSTTNTASRAQRMTVASNGGIGIGTSDSPHGGVGACKLAIEGTNSSTAGPHMQFTTASDNYPLLQILPYTHDNVNLVFDAYFDGAWKSSDASSNFKITKTATGLGVLWDNTVAQGGAVTWNNGVTLNQNGNWVVYNTQFMLERAAGQTNAAGYGQIWVKNDSPCTLWFQDDGGLGKHDSLSGFVANEHIDHTSVTLTAGTGLTGGGDISANRTFNVDVGIADDKIMQVDDADAADDDYAKFTANGLEGRSYAEVLGDLSGQATAAFSFNSQNLTSVGTIGCGVVTGTSTATFEGASVTIGKASTTTGTLVLHDSNSANTITLTVPDISAGSLSFTLPPTDGDNTNVLQTDGNGVLTWVAAGAGANHAILDGSVHTDSVADGVTRGSIIYGNATPKWDELVIGAANTFLGSDGTDLSYRTAAQVMASLSGSAAAAFDLNGQDLTNGGVLFLTEQAAAEANVAGKGQFWVLNNTPNEPWFDNDAGTSFSLDNRFVDRGDPAAADWTEVDLTMDGTWRDLDLSGVLPSNAVAVALALFIQDDAVASRIRFRENGNSNGFNVANARTVVANVQHAFDLIVACDSNQVIEYDATANTDSIDITIKGWWLA
jgi:hypothetical protein